MLPETNKPQIGAADDELHEYSSPACSLHEFEMPERKTDRAATYVLYHNPACSKSRETLKLVQANGVQPRVIEYLKTPPTEAELIAIVRKLGIAPADLVRKGEAVFKAKYAGKTLSDAQWIAAMTADPILIERPILITGNDAALGRPPENVKRLLPG